MGKLPLIMTVVSLVVFVIYLREYKFLTIRIPKSELYKTAISQSVEYSASPGWRAIAEEASSRGKSSGDH
eukprot:3119718-Pleurochrysis_carterae.AAC.2